MRKKSKNLTVVEMQSRFASMFILLSIFFFSDAITAETMPFEGPQENNQQVQDFFPAKMVSIQRQTAPGNVPVVNPTIPGTTPAGNPTTTTPSGRAWCIASSNASPTALQVALDYACGYSGADCSAIQSGGPCFDPNTVRDHASYAFNSYYQRNPVPTSCVFGGTAQLSTTDPSYGNCRFAAPTTTTPNPPATTIPNPPVTTMPNPPTIPLTQPSTTNPYTPGGSGSEPGGYDYGNEPPSSAHSTSLNVLIITISNLILSALVAHHF